MTNSYFYDVRLDEVLKTFISVRGGAIPKVNLLHEAPEDYERALSFLAEERYLEDVGDSYQITYRGKSLIEQGGFVGKHRREHILRYCTIAAAVFSFLALLVSVVALLR